MKNNWKIIFSNNKRIIYKIKIDKNEWQLIHDNNGENELFVDSSLRYSFECANENELLNVATEIIKEEYKKEIEYCKNKIKDNKKIIKEIEIIGKL